MDREREGREGGRDFPSLHIIIEALLFFEFLLIFLSL